MPEMIEVELYRRAAARAIGRRISQVRAPDAWYLKGGTARLPLERALRGAVVVDARRIGKLLLLDTDGPTVGLRFGMTGRLIVDGLEPIERLEYASGRSDPAWIRFVLELDDGGELRIEDPRRLGGVELEPATDRLGVDALEVPLPSLREGLRRSRAPLKAWLLDQQRVAGIGNLLADEMLWRGGFDPARRCDSLDDTEVRHLHRTMRSTIRLLTRRGGSHTGDLQVARVRGALCPRDGAPLQRRTIGGRTTYSCPQHQR